jgi:hypothetical protein
VQDAVRLKQKPCHADGGSHDSGFVFAYFYLCLLSVQLAPSRQAYSSECCGEKCERSGVGDVNSIEVYLTQDEIPVQVKARTIGWEARVFECLKTKAGDPSQVVDSPDLVDTVVWDNSPGQYAVIRELRERHPRRTMHSNRVENRPVGSDVPAYG